MSNRAASRQPTLYILSAPAGGGKSSLARALADRSENIGTSVSHTTRPQRPGETDGTDYFFVDLAQFEQMVKDEGFLEHAQVFGHCYGTSRHAVEQAIKANQSVLLDIDWQGAQQLKQSARNDLASVFLLPPSTGELARRLQQRAQDPADVVAARMAKAPDEISHWPEYDYIIINYEIEESVAQVQAILAAERLRRERQIGLTEFVKRLREWR